jgi:NAD(P)-dependent dehydrogenase (short-subunit alcohol dehydrogenase family)
MIDLQGRVALVTGGARDVGGAISRTLAAAGLTLPSTITAPRPRPRP